MAILKVGGQIKAEWDKFIELCNEHRVCTYLEVGCRTGEGLEYLVRNVPSINRVVAVDWPNQRWGNDSEAELDGVIHDLKGWGVDAQIILGDSHTSCSKRRVGTTAPYDCVYIDGDHTHKGCLQDLQDYGAMATKIVGCKGINVSEGNAAAGIRSAWSAYTLQHPDWETRRIIVPDVQRRGIGVLFVD